MTTSVNSQRVYIESTALFQLEPTLEKVDFEKLLQLRGAAGFRVLVAEVSWLEYIRKQKAELSVFRESCAKMERHLEKHDKSIPEVATARAQIENYLTKLDKHFRARAVQKGIDIIPLPPVELRRLLQMSIDCIPPFEEPQDGSKEKGFRDSLIMFSILESLRDRPLETGVVITNDTRLAEGLKLHADEFGASLVTVKSFDEATSYFTKYVEKLEAERIKEESEQAIRMLKEHEEEISAQIAGIRELTEADLGYGPEGPVDAWSKWRGTLSDIMAVKSIGFHGIDSAVWMDKAGSVPKILFRCLCQATVIAPARAAYQVASLPAPRVFKLGEEPEPQSGWTADYTLEIGGPVRTEERKLGFHMYGFAEFERVGSGLHLLRLSVEKSPPAELAAVPDDHGGPGSRAAGS